MGLNNLAAQNESVIVYPNPNTGKFQISSTKFQIQSLEIYNILGEKVYSNTNIEPQTINVIDVSSCPNGVYTVKVKFKNETGTTEKFVKE
jgi:hypothetical protein